VAGAVEVDLEGDDVADAVVVDRGVDGVAGGRGDAVEVGQDHLLDLLARGHGDRYAADRRAAGARAVHGYAYLEG
jgi:hypothetical protein